MVSKSLSQVPGTCPWYLFADKYEKMLIERGVIAITGVETEQPVPELSDEVGGLQAAVDGENNVLHVSMMMLRH